jgi:hypothetical protein
LSLEAAPAVSNDQGSTAYPQWVAQTATPAVASVPTAQPPSQVAPATVPSTNNQFNPSTSPSSPSNPWEAAMGSLERVLSNIPAQQSLSQAPQYPSQVQQPVTQPISQPSQVQPWAYQAQQAAPTSYTSASPTQTSSPVSTDQQAGLTNVSAEVVKHFGIEAPGILNQYACSLEDLLIDQAQRMDDLNARAGAMQTILTNPDHLADYTDRFFTEVYPVDIDGPTVEQQAAQPYQQNYDMPAPPVNAGGQQASANPQQQWEVFGEVMNRAPENAWRYLQNMGPEALRSKLLFMEGA